MSTSLVVKQAQGQSNFKYIGDTFSSKKDTIFKTKPAGCKSITSDSTKMNFKCKYIKFLKKNFHKKKTKNFEKFHKKKKNFIFFFTFQATSDTTKTPSCSTKGTCGSNSQCTQVSSTVYRCSCPGSISGDAKARCCKSQMKCGYEFFSF